MGSVASARAANKPLSLASGNWNPLPGWFKKTAGQVGIPEPKYGTAPNGQTMKSLEMRIVDALRTETQNDPEKPCLMTDLGIAEACGLSGKDEARRQRVQRALNGRWVWVDANGKRIRNLKQHVGEKRREFWPGLAQRGFLRIEHDGKTGQRRIYITLKYYDWGQVQTSATNGGQESGAEPPVIDRTVPPTSSPAERPDPRLPNEDDQGSGGVTARLHPPLPDPGHGTATDQTEPGSGGVTARLHPPLPDPGHASADQLALWIGRGFAGFSRSEQAERFRTRLRDEGLVLELTNDRGLNVRRLSPSIEPLSADGEAILKHLEPELMALFSPPQATARTESQTNGRKESAPPVRNAGEIRQAIGALTVQPNEGEREKACEKLAGLLVEAFRDADRETSRETYRGIASDVCAGRLPNDILSGAFDVACRPGKRNRGSAFIREVQRLIGESYRSHKPPS